MSRLRQCRARCGLATVLFLILAPTLHALPVCSTGVDGTVTVTGTGKRVNVYYAAPDPALVGTTTVPAGSTTIPIDAALGPQASNLLPTIDMAIKAGDVLVIMQMVGAELSTTDNHAGNKGKYGDGSGGLEQAGSLNNGNFTAGRYEFVTATGPITGGAIPIEGAGAGGGLISAYVNSNDVSASLGFRRYQVVKVPQFSRLGITGQIVPDRWNGRWGGIAAVNVRSRTDINGGSLNADGRGFRGGQFFPKRADASGGNFGFKGEGIAGVPTRLFSRALLAEQPGTGGAETGLAGYPGADGGGPSGTLWTRDTGSGAPANAGSGGGGPEDAGGGGGGNSGSGGFGGRGVDNKDTDVGIGGAPYPQHFPAAAGRLVMGGGGGASNGDDIGALNLAASSGQAGGGILLLRSRDLAGSGGGSVSAGGDSGGTAVSEGGGGGGAGGTILVHTNNSSANGLSLKVAGGKGGSTQTMEDGGGGGGSGGFIWLSDTTLGSATVVRNGGLGGDGTSTSGVNDGKADSGGGIKKGYFNGTAGANGAATVVGPLAPFGCDFVTLGIAKRVVSITSISNRIVDIRFAIVVENFGPGDNAVNVQVTDDLASAFPGVNSITVQGTPDLGGFAAPAAPFNGVSRTSLIAGTDTLSPGQTRTITYTVRIDLGAQTGPFNSQAVVSTSQVPGGFARVMDRSTAGADPDPDGDGDPTESIATGGNSNENQPTVVTIDLTVAPARCTFNPGSAQANSAVTATCTGVEPGGSVAITGMSCGVESGGRVSCNGTASNIGTNPSITTRDAAGNTTINPGNFTIIAPFDTDGDGIPDIIEGTGDSDGDGIPNFRDTDSDNDGIPDSEEEMRIPPLTGLDSDNDGIDNAIDVTNTNGADANNDGIDDVFRPTDTDGDGAPDYLDRDSDNDRIPDIIEGNADADGDGKPNYLDLDSDSDGIPDSREADNVPALSGMDNDGDGIDNAFDVDRVGGPDLNGNGIADAAEPVDTDRDGKSDYLDIDSDADGIPDAIEGTADTDRDGKPDWRDVDADNDGILDAAEGPSGRDIDGDGIDDAYDASVTGKPDADGNGIVDNLLSVDADNNGVPDADTDGDGRPDFRDLDSDNDGLNDVIEAGIADANGDALADAGAPPKGRGQLPDTDGDGRPDFRDLDSNNDGQFDIAGTPAAALDINGDGRIDNSTDRDFDGIPDVADSAPTVFGEAPDDDRDGIPSAVEGAPGTDTDRDGIPDYLDIDSDNDGIPDAIEGTVDTDGDGIPDWRDIDSDNDGIADAAEGPSGVDADNDGIDDAYDADRTGETDADGNGIVDDIFSVDRNNDGRADADTDGDGTPDYRDLDSDNDGINDTIEGGVPDSNRDGIANPGTTPKGPGTLPDTDGDGIPDFQDLDSNNDGIPDIAGTPDSGLDGNGDGQIDNGTDSDGDGIPDVSDGGPGDFGDSNDADGDGIPNDVEGGPGVDTDRDGVPDYLDLDSDNDGLPDSIELGDLDNDGIPDRIDADDGRLETAVSGGGSMDALSLVALALVALLLGRRGLTSVRAALLLAAVVGLSAVPGSNLRADSRWYGGIGGGFTHVDPEKTAGGWSTNDDSSEGYKLFVGYSFRPHWSAELSYLDGGAAGLGNINPAAEALIPNAEIDYKTPALMGVYWLRSQDQALNAFAKLGGSVIRTSASDSRIPFKEQTSAQVATGLGVQWRFTDRLFVRGEGDLYDRDHYYIGLGVGGYVGRASSPSRPARAAAAPAAATTTVLTPVPEQPAAPAPGACVPRTTTLEGVRFRSNSAELTPDSRAILNRAADQIRAESTEARVEVRAHTDNQGSDASNLELSMRRAAAVTSYLASRGIAPARLAASGYGEAVPVGDNATAEGRARNRRVELVLTNSGCP